MTSSIDITKIYKPMYVSQKKQSNNYPLQVKNILKITINNILNIISLGAQED